MATINQSQFNKSRLDKFLLVLNLPPILKDISKQYLGARENKVIIENSLDMVGNRLKFQSIQDLLMKTYQ